MSETPYPTETLGGLETNLAHTRSQRQSQNRAQDPFRKIRDSKGTLHAKTGTGKDRDGRDLTEAEDIEKRWQEYTELYRKDPHDPDNHDGVITHLEPDILECEVKDAP